MVISNKALRFIIATFVICLPFTSMANPEKDTTTVQTEAAHEGAEASHEEPEAECIIREVDHGHAAGAAAGAAGADREAGAGGVERPPTRRTPSPGLRPITDALSRCATVAPWLAAPYWRR